MLGKRAIANEIEELTTLKVMTKVYAEMAAVRMNQKRSSVLYARTFLDELKQVFMEVEAAFIAEQKRKLAAGSDSNKITLLAHNGKNVAVFLAANTRLYGDLIVRTFRTFMEDVRVTGSEATLVGKVAMTLFEAAMPNHPFTYFDMPDSTINYDDLKKLLEHIAPYDEIHLYYGKFVNVVRQEPEQYTISAQIDLEKSPQQKVDLFLFEPSVEAVLAYFEGQIFGTLVEQAVAESQLAKYAARLTAMDRAEQAVTKRLDKIRYQVLRERHNSLNKQMLNEMPSKWRVIRGNRGT